MNGVGIIAAAALILVIFLDAFEAVILPRRVKHRYRLAPLFYQITWYLWRAVARQLLAGKWRNGFLSVFGPLSLFGLLSMWALGLILGFALLHWNCGTALSFSHGRDETFGAYLYLSGTTFFTLGYGDIVPERSWGRALSVAEAGIGFAFLAIVISYLPVLYQTFSRREITISLLDARAGSPPSADQLIQRLADARNVFTVGPLLVEWERWSAELLESHLSLPVLSYYRSQHDNQSWVAALTFILDTSALFIATIDGAIAYQARLTFAMARHAAVDLGIVFRTPPLRPASERLSSVGLERLRELLRKAGMEPRNELALEGTLTELRGLYEPFINSLAVYFEFNLPPFCTDRPPIDNWQTSPWMARAPEFGNLAGLKPELSPMHDDVH